MQRTWSIRIGCALFALCLPALALAAPTKAALEQKAAAHKAQLGVTAKAPAKKTLDKQAIKEQRAKKAALKQERVALRHQLNKTGDPAVKQQLQANRTQLAAVNTEIAKMTKGGRQ